jgi:lipopolysaccharide transport system permease protein
MRSPPKREPEPLILIGTSRSGSRCGISSYCLSSPIGDLSIIVRMSVVAPDSSLLQDEIRSGLPERPFWLAAVLLDGVFAAVAYLVSYWLRFDRPQLELFLPKAWSTMPVVVAAQLTCLAIGRAYGRSHRIDWALRVVGGVVAGTLLGSRAVAMAVGFNGLSRLAFVADAVLLSMTAIAWRAVWAIQRRARLVSRARSDDLIDRAQDMRTVGGIVMGLYDYRELLKNLVLKDLKLKYRGSVFGFLWSLANPLLMTVVYTLAFTFILRIRSESFVFSLLLAQLSWTFFASSAMMSTGAIVDNAGLLKSVLFPREILPVGIVLFNLAQYMLTVAVFLPLIMMWYRAPLSAPMTLFPAFLALQVVFTIGVALALSTATAFFRDVRHLLEVALSVLFWSTPILYELTQVPDRLRLVILLSPLSSFVVAYQQMFVHQRWPDGAIWLIAGAQAFVAFTFGVLIFMAFQDRFTDQL